MGNIGMLVEDIYGGVEEERIGVTLMNKDEISAFTPI